MAMPNKAAVRAARARNVATPYTMVAPIGGLNTKDALANMPETDATIIDNCFCQPTWVEIRGGHKTLATYTGSGQTLIPYSALAAANNQMFAAINNAGTRSIVRVDNAGGGAVGFPVVGGAPQTLTGFVITGVAGQFSVNAATLTVGMQVTIAGTFGGSGSISGYVNPTTYVVSATNGTTTGTLISLAGGALTTVAGTPTGLTITAVPTATVGSAYYDYNQFGSGTAEVVYLLNGVDLPLLYDGTTWYQISTTSPTYSLTGGPAQLSSLRSSAVYKQRLWFVQANSMNVYYLAQNTFAGALTLLNMAPNFKLGGFIAAMITVSIDNSNGTSDYIAFVSNQGECVMFQGYDPSSISTWNMAAHFRIGAPIGVGRQCWQKMGMDAALICQDGLMLLSEAMLTDRSQNKLTLSDKIRYGINQAIDLFGANQGWQLTLFPPGNKLILNVPTAATSTTSYQYVMNTLSGAWVTWGQLASPLNAGAFENFNNNLYYAGQGSVEQADTGLADNGNPIQWSAKQAYSYMGEKTNLKRFTMAQPLFIASGNVQLAYTLSLDFDSAIPSANVPVTAATGSPWNTSLWTTPTFWGDQQQVVNNWLGLQGAGYAAAFYMTGATNGVYAKWQQTVFLFEEGATLYGK